MVCPHDAQQGDLNPIQRQKPFVSSSPPAVKSVSRQGEFLTYTTLLMFCYRRLPAFLHSPAAAACLLLASLAGCATPEQMVEDRRHSISTAPITHVVLIQLKDPTRAAELVEDCNRLVPGIQSVKDYSCGIPFPSGRANVVENYSVGFLVTFQDEEGYKAYTDDPAHLALVEKWRNAWKEVRIFDFLDAPPGAAPALQPVQPAPAATPGTAPATNRESTVPAKPIPSAKPETPASTPTR